MVEADHRVFLRVVPLLFIQFVDGRVDYLFGADVALAEVGQSQLPALRLEGSESVNLLHVDRLAHS